MKKRLTYNTSGAALREAALWFCVAAGAAVVFAFPSGVRAAAPPAPVSVHAENSDRGGVYVTWERPTLGLVLSYNVYRSTKLTSLGTRIAIKVVGVDFLDTKAVTGNRYYYRVSSVAQDGTLSASSDPYIIDVRDIVNPDPPTRITGYTKDGGYIKVTWHAPANEQASSYQVYRSSSPGVLGSLVKEVRTTSFTEYSMTGGQMVYYIIRAIDRAGNISDDSAQLGVQIINSADAPLRLAEFSAAPTGKSGQIKLTWKRPSTSNFSYVNIYRSIQQGIKGQLVVEQAKGTTYTDQGLTNGQEYYYIIQPVSKGGVVYEESAQVHASAKVSSKNAPPPPIARLRAQDQGDGTSILLTWILPNANTFRQVKIYRSTDRDARGDVIASGLKGTRYTDTGLESDTRYFYTVVTVDANGVETAAQRSVGSIATLALLGEDGTNDTDGDGLPDTWERDHGFHPRARDNLEVDDDEDGLALRDEYRYGTDPWDSDSDEDGFNDGTETANGFDPAVASARLKRETATPVEAGSFAYGKKRLSNITEEQSLATRLRTELENIFGRGRIPNPRAHWPALVNAYVYGGYTAGEIADTLRFGPGKVHPSVPAAAWRTSDEYKKR